MEMDFNELIEAISGDLVVSCNDKKFNKVCTDTRKIEKGNVFLALKGEKFNANEYVKEAINKGASVVIVDEILFNEDELCGLSNVIKVNNTYDALLDLAAYYRKKLNIKVVGVTGSTGKTSTKDLVAAFLSGKYKVFKTKGNFNNHIGMPLMILELDSSYDVAVLEFGMSNLGEIHTLVKCARPDIGMITNIGLSHIENLKTQDNILKAKLEITDYFDKDNLLILNNEDEFLSKVHDKNFRIEHVGYKNNCDIKAINVEIDEKTTSFTIKDDKEYRFVLPMVGKHNVLNALLGIAASKELNVSYEEMLEGLKKLEATSMRLEFIKKDKITIINDAYNASPDSMKAALDVLNNCTAKRKVAILGTMRELGDESERAHEEVARYAKDKIDLLIVTGEYSKNYKIGFDNNAIQIYNTKEELINNLSKVIKEGDAIVVKASRGMKYEDIVKALENIEL